jgi:hypothetical protein
MWNYPTAWNDEDCPVNSHLQFASDIPFGKIGQDGEEESSFSEDLKSSET